jgi:hypothetical protein
MSIFCFLEDAIWHGAVAICDVARQKTGASGIYLPRRA